MEYVVSVVKGFWFCVFFFFPGTRVSKHHKLSSHAMQQSHRAAFLSTLSTYFIYFMILFMHIYCTILLTTCWE